VRICSFILLIPFLFIHLSQANAQNYERLVDSISNIENPNQFPLSQFYSTGFSSLIEADSVAAIISTKLKQNNFEICYLLNEISRVRLATYQGKLKLSLARLEKINAEIDGTESHLVLGALSNAEAGIHMSSNLAEQAADKYQIALAHYIEHGDLTGMKGGFINLGNTFSVRDEWNKAAFYYAKADSLEAKGVEVFSEYLIANKANLYIRKKDFKSALRIFKKTLAKLETKKDITGHPLTLFNLGRCYLRLNLVDSAIFVFQKVNAAIDTNNLESLAVVIKRELAMANHLLGNDSLAFQLMIDQEQLQNQQGRNVASQKLAEAELRHKTVLFEKQKSFDQAQLETQVKNNNILYAVIGIILFTFHVILFFWIRLRQKSKLLISQNLELVRTPSSSGRIDLDERKIFFPDLINSLENAIYQDEVFKEQGLTLEGLAKRLDTNRSYLSESINSHYGISYSSLINDIRIKEARKMLACEDYAKYSIEGISQMIGFRSLSSFNSQFKKITGITPSIFRKSATAHFNL